MTTGPLADGPDALERALASGTAAFVERGQGGGYQSALAAAEARGYAKAVANLRDRDAWLRWSADHDEARLFHPEESYARYLMDAKETTDHA